MSEIMPSEVRAMLMAIFSTQIMESEEIQEELERRHQRHQLRKVAEDYAAAQIEKMLQLGADHGLDWHVREIAIETKLPPAPRFWAAWERMATELGHHTDLETTDETGKTARGYWLPGGKCALPPPPHESIARDLAAREPLPPALPPPAPAGMTALEVQGIVAEIKQLVSAAVAAAVAKPEETVTELETTNAQGQTSTSKVRSRRRPLA